jgi:molecular chaperone DnaJ
MASKKDYYETLETQKGATDDEIKKAYRKLAKKYHPDANPDNPQAEQNFKEVSEAYSVLSDQTKKNAYDQYGHSAFDQSGGGGFSSDFDMGDIFNMFTGGSFSGFGGSARRQGPKRGADLQTNIQITFEQAFFGVDKDITLPMNEICSTCNGNKAKVGTVPQSCKSCGGTGAENIQQQTMFGAMIRQRTCTTCRGEGKIIKEHCVTCRGSGKIRKSKTIQANIPKGIDNGQSIRLGGRGEPGEPGASNGDLLVTVYVSAHKLFVRNGDDIHLNVPITFVQAALGAEITIPTMDDEEKKTIKAGTQTGTIITFRGKGFPNVRSNRISGDLIATLVVSVPTSLTDKQKQTLVQFSDEMGEDYKDHKKSFIGGIFKK